MLLSILNKLTSGVIVADSDGNFVLWNDMANSLIKVPIRVTPVEEWTGFYGVFKMDSETRYTNEELPLLRACAGDTVVKECLFVRNEMKPLGIYLSVNAYPVVEDGDTVGGIAIFDDISKEVETKVLLREFAATVEHMKAVLESSIDQFQNNKN